MSSTPSIEDEEKVREANRERVNQRVRDLNNKMGVYFANLSKLGQRGARRKARLTPEDIQLWHYVRAQHAAMDAARAKVLGIVDEKEKAAPEGTAEELSPKNPH